MHLSQECAEIYDDFHSISQFAQVPLDGQHMTEHA